MIDELKAWTAEHRDPVDAFLRRCFAENRVLMLQSDLCGVLAALAAEPAHQLDGTPLQQAVRHFQEGVLQSPWAYFALREGAGRWRYLRMHQEQLTPERVSVSEFLAFKEQLVKPAARLKSTSSRLVAMCRGCRKPVRSGRACCISTGRWRAPCSPGPRWGRPGF